MYINEYNILLLSLVLAFGANLHKWVSRTLVKVVKKTVCPEDLCKASAATKEPGRWKPIWAALMNQAFTVE